ncbi:MAG: energy transducer TonB [Bacteroidales bacterium]|nr:energy transducer TonB [Bacteroidales bacterium]
MITQLLLYSLKAALTLTLLYVPYTLMLQKERFFSLNRIVLLGIIILSLLLPLCNISWMSLDNSPIMQATHQQMIEVGIPVRVADDGITVSYQLAAESTSVSWFTILAIVFFVGMTASVLIRSLQLGILSYVMRRKNLWTKRQEDGVRICCRKGSFTPYSWMHTIVISEEDWDDGRREIVLHETGHIRAHHSWDMLLLMLCQALQWYNPFVWMIGHSLADVHEYEADDYVLRQGVQQRDYMMLLVKKVALSQGYSFVNGLNKSTLNKRILMMKEKVTSNPWMRAKLLYLLPVCALVLSAFATPQISAPVETVLTKLENRSIEKADTMQTSIASELEQVNDILAREEMAEDDPLVVIDGKIANGGKLADVLEKERLKPDMITNMTILKGVSATSVWGERGKNGAIVITTIHTAEKQDEAEPVKTESDLLLQDIVSRIPDAKIGADGSVYVNGKKVEKLLVNDKDQLAGEQSASETEVQPVLEDGARIYSMNFRYPREAQEYGVQGRVKVDFYVEPDGTLSEVTASRHDGSSSVNTSGVTINAPSRTSSSEEAEMTDEERKAFERGEQAMLRESERVVKLTSGKWTPGYVEDAQGNRTPKRMKMSVPLNFQLR